MPWSSFRHVFQGGYKKVKQSWVLWAGRRRGEEQQVWNNYQIGNTNQCQHCHHQEDHPQDVIKNHTILGTLRRKKERRRTALSSGLLKLASHHAPKSSSRCYKKSWVLWVGRRRGEEQQVSKNSKEVEQTPENLGLFCSNFTFFIIIYYVEIYIHYILCRNIYRKMWNTCQCCMLKSTAGREICLKPNFYKKTFSRTSFFQ